MQIDADRFIRPLHSDLRKINKKLISAKTMTPTGALNWALDLELCDKYIKSGFSFAWECTSDMFKRAFQYKFMTQTIPTNEYLNRYLVTDTSNITVPYVLKETPPYISCTNVRE